MKLSHNQSKLMFQRLEYIVDMGQMLAISIFLLSTVFPKGLEPYRKDINLFH